jgi:asparagine synthase (glutamine-hydrolysing)
VNRRFIACLGVAAPVERFAAAALGDGANTIQDGRFGIAFTGPRPHTSGSCICVLDGMLDDRFELAAALGVGRDSSAEALIATGWSSLGPRLLDRLRGEWAFVIWDRGRRLAVAACDRLGARALYYARSEGGLVIAPELSDAIRALRSRPDVDSTSMAHWLSGSGPPVGRTMYAGVGRLAGGHRLEAGGRDVSHRRWWLPRFQEPLRTQCEDVASHVREVLRTAVARAAPPQAAVLLSGGLDSGAVAAVLTDGGRRRGCRAYSIVFPDHPSVDERELIESMARDLALESRRLPGSEGPILDAAMDYLRASELPPSSPNLLFWMPLLHAAKSDGVAVMLDGEGGDELFGEARYLLADRMRAGHPLAAWKLARRFPGAGDRPSRRILLGIMRNYAVSPLLPSPARRAAAPAPAWLRAPLRQAYIESQDEREWGDVPRWWRGLLESIAGSSGPVLARDHVRRRSKQAGVEPRHPLLDADLVELILMISPDLAFDPHLSRPVLRHALKGVLPDAIRLRPEKSTFDAVFQHSLTGAEAGRIRSLITDPAAELGHYADLRGVVQMLSTEGVSASGGVRRWALLVWRLATAELFLRHQSEWLSDRAD